MTDAHAYKKTHRST